MTLSSVAAVRTGRLAQLVRALPSHGRGQRFKSFVAHHRPPIWLNHFLPLNAGRPENVGFLCSTRYLLVRLHVRTGCNGRGGCGIGASISGERATAAGAAQRRGDCADMGRSVLRPYTMLWDPLGRDGGFGAAVAAAAA